MGTKISAATERLLANVTGNESVPIDDGTATKLRVILSTIRSYVIAAFTNKTTVLDNLSVSDGLLAFSGVYARGFALYSDTFENSDLTAGVLSVNHANATEVVIFHIVDPNGIVYIGSTNTIVDDNNVTIDFGGDIEAGTWKLNLICVYENPT